MRRYALVIVMVSLGASSRAGLPEAPPSAVGFDAEALERVDAILRRAVDQKKVPGAVVVVGRRGKIAFARAYGQRRLVPTAQEMTRDTLFDLASLTKPVATATSIMTLIERGDLKLEDRLGSLLPEFDNQRKGEITLEQLLRHRSGLIADNPISDYRDGPEASWRHLAELGLVARPGSRFLYSDVNYIILGRIIEKKTGQPLDVYAAREVFEPLGMTETFFPASAGRETIDKARYAPTEREGDAMLSGEVHDPRARALGGVAGHAGLFGTADDLALFAQMLLDGGRSREGRSILKPETVRAMTSPGDTPAGQKRGLGWDIATPFGSPRGRVFGPRSFGHTGFTGTSLWIDPETETFVVLLTSRLHPDGKAPSPSSLRSEIATAVGRALIDAPVQPVDCGIDVLMRENFARLKDKKVGLVTNHTGRARDGRSTIDVLSQAPGVKLVALFSPEHGLRGLVDKEVADGKDEATGLPIFSLYGKTRKPSPPSLRGVDVLVYDIQDIGTRFYTYISTLGLLLEAAAEAQIPVMVLDRPNPIGGEEIGGPARDEEFASFIAHHALPVRHGMTVGELAKMFAAERKIAVDLTVVPCEGWKRADLFDRTGLLWVNPSPNMRSPEEALLYPGVGLLEATNLATGRGTDTPFERVGAPWIDPVAWSRSLNALALPGVRFVPVRFSPTERQHAGKDCGGVLIQVTDRDRLDPIDLGLGLAFTLRRDYEKDWQPEGFLKMLADRGTYDALLKGASPAEMKALYRGELEAFREVRKGYLLYP